jgi:molybdopterin molybdotransferase
MTEIKIAVSCADASDTSSLKVAQARQQILDSVSPIQAEEKKPLRSALGHVLAETIKSPLDVPGHTNSAMDGYAMRGEELPSDDTLELKVSGTAYAGKGYNGSCEPGCCVRIMTGAPMPTGCDTVIMQEHAERTGENMIRIGSGHRTGQNVRYAGEDIPRGSTVFETGRTLTPADIGILASLGVAEVKTRLRPRIAFFSTGDELVGVGQALAEGEIYDSNRYSLYGMLRRLNVDIIDMGVIPDDPHALRKTFEDAGRIADMVITSGGVSVGEADYTKPILDELGDMHFWRIAMKPGRPLVFGKLRNAHFFGLPGNPVAVMVTFYQFVQPAIEILASGKAKQPLMIAASASRDIRKRAGRYEFLRGIFEQDGNGHFSVAPTGTQGSGILTSMSKANCFIHLPEENAGIAEGETVLIQPFDALI